MSKNLTVRESVAGIIVPSDATKDRKSQLQRFARFQAQQGRQWHDPDLSAYRDDLERTLAPSSVSAHLSTVRARYRAILRDPQRRDDLYSLAGEHLAELGQDDNPANRAAFVVELERRITNALDPASAPVKTKTRQDKPDSEHIRLTSEQASALMRAPGLDTLRSVRDTAIIALMLCTGIREMELCSLDVGDLRQRLEGELALHVKMGKGCKERLVPYGALSGVLAIVDL